ncbi:MAG: hypothetical protein JXR91_05880 [Deltaproteobacteria bacterium]|nr:hypothetical protein [Deltaproteobacteria bacterium]
MKLSIFRLLILVSVFSAISIGGCGSDSNDDSKDDTATDSDTSDNGTDTTVDDSDSDTGADSNTEESTDDTSDTSDTADTADTAVNVDPTADQTIGSACSCATSGCEALGIPVPNGGTPVGCDDVPTDVTGAEVVCLRSYSGTSANQTWFANGLCSLQATGCTGAVVICDQATFGDYDNMTACPADHVMISSSTKVAFGTMEADVDSKACAKSCETDSDCRNDETDEVWEGEATQYGCIDKDGVKFCYDPRNLSDNYTVEAF